MNYFCIKPKHMSEKTILVPSDFSKVADTAMNHAAVISKSIGSSVTVLHVVSNESKIDVGNQKLEMYIERHQKENPGVEFKSIIQVGNIFEDIGDVSKNIGASLIVMGTHGMRGMQFLVGSNALRVVSNSATPIIIVQERLIREGGYDNILVPLDLHKETKQKLNVVADLGKYFESKVHLLSPNETDEHLQNQLTRNVAFASQYLSERGIESDARVSDEDSSDFDDGVVRNASALDADLIAIMNLGNNSLMGIFGGKFSQNVITNASQIPVLILNPKETSGISDFFGAYG
ncbi:MAG: universal stress protein [Flavobacteriales bacterium]|nr:universal stress protein [Flavobacteriales bacterium]